MKVKLRRGLFLFYFLVGAIALFIPNAGANTREGVTLKISARQATQVGEGVIRLEGGVRVVYQDIIFQAEVLELDQKKSLITTEGKFILTQRGIRIEGKGLQYNFNTQTGKVQYLHLAHFPPWYVRGKDIEKISDEEYLVQEGYFTTCNLPHPHYYLKGSPIKIYAGERIEARNVLFYLRGIPLFYFPYYIADIRRSPYGWVVWTGHNSCKGWMVLSHYNWGDYPPGKGRVYIDYLERKGWGEGMDYEYRLPRAEGYIYGYGMREKEGYYDRFELEEGRKGEGRLERWKLYFRHRQEFTPQTTGIIVVNRLSDARFNLDFLPEEVRKGWSESSLRKEPKNYLSLWRDAPAWDLGLLYRKHLNEFQEEVERLPEAEFSGRERRLGSSPFFFRTKAQIANLRQQPEEISRTRYYTENELSLPLKVGTWLNVNPFLSYQGILYEKEGEEELTRDLSGGGVEISTELEKVFDLGGEFPYPKVRHILEPVLSYYWRESSGEEDFPLFDEVDALKDENFLRLELINRLEGKAKDKSIKEILRLRMSADYGLDSPDRGWRDLGLDLILNPRRGLNLDWESKYSLDRGRFRYTTLSFNLEGKKRWETRWGVSYYRDEKRFQIDNKTRFNISPQWKLDLYNRYDGEKGRWEETSLAIQKDLHCWTAHLVVRQKYQRERETQVLVRFTLKAL